MCIVELETFNYFALTVHVCCIICMSGVNVKGRPLCVHDGLLSEVLPVVPAKLGKTRICMWI